MNKPDGATDTSFTHAFEVAGKTVDWGAQPFFIAEVGSNFNQDLDTGYRLIDAAAEAGADAVKFQLFRPESLYPPGTPGYDAVSAVTLKPDWVPLFAAHAKARNIAFMASAFDIPSVEVLEAVGVPAHKVASSEATNLPLLSRIASTGKPVFLATGMCDMVDVHDAVKLCIARGNRNVALMQCGAMYPLPPELSHLKVIDVFRETFRGPAGLSDHTLGMAASIAAVARGAAVIEKHFTLDRKATGPDHFYALEVPELRQLVSMIRETHAALGRPVKEMLPDERKFGRRNGLYAARDIAAGETIGPDAIAVRRPAVGLRERYFRDVAGHARAARAIKADAPIAWDDIEL